MKIKLNNWTKEYVRNLIDDGVSLKGLDLSGECFDGFDMRGANLIGTNLTGASLIGADLRGAKLYGVILVNTNLTSVNLEGTELSFVDLGDGVTLDNANLSKAVITHENMSNIGRLYRVNLREANLTGTVLSNTELVEVDLWKANLSWVNLSQSKIINCNLSSGTLFSKGFYTKDGLRDACFKDTDLSNVDFRNIKLYYGTVFNSPHVITLNGRGDLYASAHKSKMYDNPSQVRVRIDGPENTLEYWLSLSPQDWIDIGLEESSIKHYTSWVEGLYDYFSKILFSLV